MKYFIYNHLIIKTWCIMLALTSVHILNAGQVRRDALVDFTEKDMIEVLHQMSEHYQVFFTYDSELLKNVKVDFEFRQKESFDNAIKRLMRETGFEYNVYNSKYLVIYKNDKQGKKAAKKMGKMIKEMEKLESDGHLSVKYNSKMPERKLANMVQSIK